MTGFYRFVAPSYGSQRKVYEQMEAAMIEFNKQEKNRLASDMKPKEITVCQDETFHPAPCLLAIEPTTNFLLLEEYSKSRKHSDWTEAVEKTMKNLPVTIVQSTSDEGRAILNHVKNGLAVHY